MVRGDGLARRHRIGPAPACARPPQPGYSRNRTPLAQTGDGGGSVKQSVKAVGLVCLFATLAFMAAGCGGGGNESSSGNTTTTSSGGGGGNVSALPSSACASIYYE